MDERLGFGKPSQRICIGDIFHYKYRDYSLGTVIALREEKEGVYYVITAIILEVEGEDKTEYVDAYGVYRVTDVSETGGRAHPILKKWTKDYNTALKAYLQGGNYHD